MPVATPFVEYQLFAFIVLMLVLLFIGLRFKIPLFMVFAGLICLDIAIELGQADAGIIPITVFAVLGLYLGLTTLRGLRS